MPSPNASSIASHGRTGQVSAMSIGSWGRLTGVREVIGQVIKEVIFLIGKFSPIVSLRGEVSTNYPQDDCE